MKMKWNPMTHAIYNGNLEVIKHLFNTCLVNSKKVIRVPSLYNSNEVNKLFPFYVALSTNNEEMFEYFWSEQRHLQWNADSFELLFKLLAKREASHLIASLMRSRTTQAIFLGMSYTYRSTIMDHLLATQDEILDEINVMLQ